MWILLWMGCQTQAEREQAAYALALAGDPAAQAACVALHDAATAGDCLVLLAEKIGRPEAMKDICAAILDPKWRGECAFVQAEAYLEAGNLDAAIQSCHDAGPFVKDCARHIWQQSARANTASAESLVQRLATEFPEVTSALDVRQNRVQVQIEKEKFRTVDRLSMGLCQDASSQAVCQQALVRVLGGRWKRAAAESEEVKKVLCTVPLVVPEGPAFRQLAWDADPALDAAVAETRERVCGP